MQPASIGPISMRRWRRCPKRRIRRRFLARALHRAERRVLNVSHPAVVECLRRSPNAGGSRPTRSSSTGARPIRTTRPRITSSSMIPPPARRARKSCSRPSLEARNFANSPFPQMIAPPLLTKYQPGQYYGAHADAAFINLGNHIIRSDLSCTIFLNDPASYDGGALLIRLGDGTLSFKLNPGEAIIYPSDTFHEVEKVTKRRAAGGDHLHPEQDRRPVPPQPAVRSERGRRA